MSRWAFWTRTYDAHDYLEEKRAALAALYNPVSGESASPEE
ncbi:MAG: hypothetical protein ACP5GC_01045 [Thiomonas sp.]